MTKTEQTNCGVCGKPSAPGKKGCSSGCSLARWIPVGDEALPVSLPLCLALGAFFILFNQGLFATMHGLAEALGKDDLLGKFEVTSFVFGFLWLGFAIYFLAIAEVWKWADRLALLFCILIAFLPRILGPLSWPYLYTFAIANSLMAIWLGRGLVRLWWSRKNVKSSSA